MNKKTLVIHCLNHFHFIRMKDINYCQSDDCYTTIYLESKSITVSKSLIKISQELPPEQFVRVSQSYLINRDMICSIDKRKKTISLSNGAVVPFTISIKMLIALMQTGVNSTEENSMELKEARSY